MEKSDKKRILTRVLIVIAALTLLSCCFLGSTFARYVTNASGTAQIGVAKWDVAVTPAETLDVTVDANKLSPSMTVYDSSTHAANPRSKTSDKFLVATIANTGDVNAEITVSSSSASCDKIEKPTTNNSDYEKYSENEAVDCFSIKFFTSTTNSAESANKGLEGALNVETDKTIYIFAQVTWTSQDTAEKSGDALDTWIGKYVTSVSWTLSYTATQNSELPTT